MASAPPTPAVSRATLSRSVGGVRFFIAFSCGTLRCRPGAPAPTPIVCLTGRCPKSDFILRLFFEVSNGHLLLRILAYTSCAFQFRLQAASVPNHQPRVGEPPRSVDSLSSSHTANLLAT